MPESENALWAKTRRRNMAAPRRRTERSESAAHSRARRPAAFPTSGAAKTAPAGRTLARRQKPPRRAPVLRAAVRKNKRGKTPRPNSWTEASAPAANRAERERRPRKRKAKTRAFAIDKPPCNRL